MFNHLFFTQAAAFRAQVENANAGKLDPELRHVGFTLFCHELLGWFRDHPSLQSVKLTSVALAELESAPKAVRIRHHLKLTSLGHPVDSSDEQLLGLLPWSLLGDGVFEIARSHPTVQAYLALNENDTLSHEGHIQYAGMVHALALHVDAAFESFLVQHDLGLASSTR